MIKQIFDQQQPEYTLSKTGRVFICVNEQEVQVTETSTDDNGEEIEETVTKYQYDTAWIKPIKQSEEAILQAFKEYRIDEIDEYDTSDAVNNFVLDGISGWFSRDLRVSLRDRYSIEQENGKTTTTIWINDQNIDISIDNAISFLSQLELYAVQCYDVTAAYKQVVNACSTIAEVGAIDITTNYPTIIEYTSSENS